MSKTSTKPSGRSAKAAPRNGGKNRQKTGKKRPRRPQGGGEDRARGGVEDDACVCDVAQARPRGRHQVQDPGSKILASKILRTVSPPTQPIVTQELPARSHKYQVGEAVYYTSPTFGRAAATGSYTVVKLLPSEGDDYQYRIKSSGEAFERVAKESQLDRA